MFNHRLLPRIGMFIVILLLVSPVYAAPWLSSGIDLGIGLVAIKQGRERVGGIPGSGGINGLPAAGLPLYRQPDERYPKVGQLVNGPEGLAGIDAGGEFYPLAENGVSVGLNRYAWVSTHRRRQWVNIIVRQSPRLTGWLRLTPQNPLGFQLWIRHMQTLVASKTPLFFVTPVSDDVVHHSIPEELGTLKNLFQMEDAVLYPEKLDGAYLLVRAGQPLQCPTSPVPRFEAVKPVRGWIRWLSDEGRPSVLAYPGQPCP